MSKADSWQLHLLFSFSCLTASCLFDLQCASVRTCIFIYNLGSITLTESQITYLSILTNTGLIYTLDHQMKGSLLALVFPCSFTKHVLSCDTKIIRLLCGFHWIKADPVAGFPNNWRVIWKFYSWTLSFGIPQEGLLWLHACCAGCLSGRERWLRSWGISVMEKKSLSKITEQELFLQLWKSEKTSNSYWLHVVQPLPGTWGKYLYSFKYCELLLLPKKS